MSHYRQTGDPPDRPSDIKDENYDSPSHYDDTGGEHVKHSRPNSNYADTSEGLIR